MTEYQDHVWSYDRVEDRTYSGRKLQMLKIIDKFTPQCMAFGLPIR